jgi:hypothetical protein
MRSLLGEFHTPTRRHAFPTHSSPLIVIELELVLVLWIRRSLGVMQ